MPVPRVSVLIVSYNGAHHVRQSLPALARQRGFAPGEYEVIIIDNASTDDSVATARSILPDARIIQLNDNRGFAGAMDAGYREARGEWIVVLNDDAVPEADWLIESLAALDAWPGDANAVGMIASAVLRADDPTRYESVGLALTTAAMGIHRKADARVTAAMESEEVLGPTGAAGLYRAAMLNEIGFFDPDFFIYYEDLDLALRAQAAGWRCITAPRARVHHQGTGTITAAAKVYYIHRNKWIAWGRAWPGMLMARYGGILLATDLGAWVRAVRAGHGGAATRGRVQALMGLLGLRAPRVPGRRRVVRALRRWLVPAATHIRSVLRAPTTAPPETSEHTS